MLPAMQKTFKLLNYDSDVLLQRSWSSDIWLTPA
jgi:hypothetical protein